MKKILCAVVIISCMVLSACSVSVRGRSGKSIVDVNTDGITVDAGDTHVKVDVGKVVVETGNDKKNTSLGNEKVSRDYTKTYEDTSDTDELNVQLDMGNIEVTAEDRDNVEYDYEVKVNGIVKETCDELLDKVECVVEKKGDKIYFYPGVIGEDTSLSRYIEKHYFGYSVTLNLYIKVPASFNIYEISTDMGNIDVDSLTGKLLVETDMGNITAKNIVFTDDSKLLVDMGNIDTEIAKNDIRTADIKISTDMGSINFDCNGNSYTKEKDNDFMESSAELKIEDILEVELDTDMGDISIIG